MVLTLVGHDAIYQVEQLQQALFGVSPEGTAVSTVEEREDHYLFHTQITIGDRVTEGQRQLKKADYSVKAFHKCLRQSYYDAALPHLPQPPAWGALAGVRPTKLSTRHLLEGGTEDSAHRLLEEEYYVTKPRRDLALACSQASVWAVEKTEKQDLSVYIGIPFCPTRCSYCSFVSRTAGKKTALLDTYLEKLIEEIAYTGKLLTASGRTIRSLYMGGGTPTTLSSPQLLRLLEAVSTHFDLSRCIEYTVEAGRPDTLTEEKLQILSRFGVDRISINPQSMQDGVLAACKRPHTPEDVKRMFRIAENLGFKDINMDLIAGLPQDTPEGFGDSLEQLLSLRPSNITVHTLALKKGADLFESREKLPTAEEVETMLQYAQKRLTQEGYVPYYLYRQKYMSGNFENIGWSRDNRHCLYNIYMMEELHPILSLGGGGMSKVNLPGGKLERFHNPKFPEQYVSGFSGVLTQKDAMFQLLNTL